MDLVIETEALTPDRVAAMCASREQPELTCDRCQDPNEIVVAAMEIAAIDETFALCGACASQLPGGFRIV